MHRCFLSLSQSIIVFARKHTFIVTRQRRFPLVLAFDVCHYSYRIRHVCCRSAICISFSYFNDNNCRLSTTEFKAAMKRKIDTCSNGILASFFFRVTTIISTERVWWMRKRSSFSYEQLTSIVEDSEEVEVGDVSMLLSRYFLFIARLHRAFQLA
jgi:hypothetical protein